MSTQIYLPVPIVTTDDVRVISRYVSTGKLLPLTAEGVKSQINNAPETLVTEIVNHYKIINTHANSWEKTQDSMIKISSVLVAFSKDIHEYGDEAVEIIKNMEGYKSRKIKDLSEAELETLPSISLDGDDQAKLPNLEQTVKYIKTSINEKKQKSILALADLDSFKNVLSYTIEPWIGQMVQVSNPDALDMQISNIRLELNKLSNDIKQINVKPSQMQTLFEFSRFINPLLALLTEGQKKGTPAADLIKQREEILAKIAGDNQLKGVLHTLYIGMGSLYDVVESAIKAVSQLHSHWENILALIDDALNQFKSTANYAYLGLFVRKLEVLLIDWREIEDNSASLMDAFRLEIR